MLGGSSCKISGGKQVKRSGGTGCEKMQGGKRKSVKKSAKKGKGKGKRGGGLCVGNLAEFETAFDNSSASSSVPAAAAPTPAPVPAPAARPSMPAEMEGGAKKRKSRKAGPYAKFVKKHFASVQKKNPKFKATDCMKEIAKMWRAQKK